MLIENLGFLILAVAVLVLSGTYLIKSLSKVAAFLHLSEFTISFILMAFATSVPELFVGISSALAKTPSLALGNIIGANIANLTLIMGIAVLISKKFKIENKKTKKDAMYMFFIILIPLILMWLGKGLSRIDGAILILVFLAYVYNVLRQRKQFTKPLDNHIPRKEGVFNTIILCVSLALLFFSSKYIVTYATGLATDLNLPIILVGLVLIALGTTLPELIFTVRAGMMGHSEMAFGDIIGSVIANSTLILGVTAIIYPITNSFTLFMISAAFMILVTFLFATFMETSNRLTKLEGIALIMLYVFFIIIEFYFKTV